MPQISLGTLCFFGICFLVTHKAELTFLYLAIETKNLIV